MNRLRLAVLLLLFLALPGLIRAQVSIVQSAKTNGTPTSSAASAVFGSNLSSTNNYILVTCVWFATGSTVTVTDNSSGDSYSDTGSGAVENSTTGTIFIQTFKSKVSSTANGTKPTVTCNYSASGGSNGADIVISEIGGADGTTFVDAHNSAVPNPAANTVTSAGSLTTSSAYDLIYAVCVPNGSIPAPGPGYSLLQQTANDESMEVGLTNTGGTGTFIPTFLSKSSGSDNWACNDLAIKAANQTTGPAVAFGNSFAGVTDTSATTWSWTHTVANGGANGVLYVTLHWRNTQSGVAPTVTYNSVSMTEMQAAACYNGTSYGTTCTDVWYLVAPSSGAHTVSVTYHATTDGEEDSVDFTGVNQTTPFSSIQSDTTQNSSASLAVTSKVGDFVLSRITVITGITALCAANSTVQDWQARAPTFGLWAGVGHAAGASSVTMNWTQSSTTSCPGTLFNSEHSHVAFDVAAASSSPTTRNMPAAVY